MPRPKRKSELISAEGEAEEPSRYSVVRRCMPAVACCPRERRCLRGDECGDNPKLAGGGMKECVVETDTRKPVPLSKTCTSAKLKDAWMAEMYQSCEVIKNALKGAAGTVCGCGLGSNAACEGLGTAE